MASTVTKWKGYFDNWGGRCRAYIVKVDVIETKETYRVPRVADSHLMTGDKDVQRAVGFKTVLKKDELYDTSNEAYEALVRKHTDLVTKADVALNVAKRALAEVMKLGQDLNGKVVR